jgi:hypothetical protein
MGLKKSIKVRVHEAFFLNNDKQYLFVNIANKSKFRQLTVTHLYYVNGEQTLDILCKPMQAEIGLPITLEASESMEFAIPKQALPNLSTLESHFNRFRVRISTGRIYASQKNHTLLASNPLVL